MNGRVREWWSRLSVDPYSPGYEDKNLRTSDVETTIDNVTQQKPTNFAFLPLVDDPMTQYFKEVHGLILVPVTGGGLFRRIDTFGTLRYLNYPKQIVYQEEERNVFFRCKEVTVIHEGGFLKQNKKESSLSSEAKGVGTFESFRSGFTWEGIVLCGQKD